MANFGASVYSNDTTGIITGTAASSVSAGDVVYQSNTTGKWAAARSDALGTIGAAGIRGDMGVALGGAVASQRFEILINGYLENCTGLTKGTAYAVSDSTAGEIILYAGLTVDTDYATIIGAADSTTSAFISPINTRVVPTNNNGTAATNVSATHYGDNHNVMAVLTLTDVPLTVGSSEDLAVGVLIYTLPAGDLTVEHAVKSLAIAGVSATGDTPDVGLGTTIGAGAVTVLGGTAAFENIITGQTAADTNGTATFASAAPALSVATGGDHTVYFNAADGWGANADADGTVNGTVVLKYRYNEA